MIDNNLFLTILFGLATIYVAIGIWMSRKIKTLNSYFLANRNLGVFKLTFTLVATQLGSGMILGTAQQAYDFGFVGILYTVGMSLGFIILGLGLASKMRSLNVSTTAEIFETRYNSPKLKLIASALSIISLWGILVAQIIASKILFASIGINDPYILGAFWTFLVFYTMIGGLDSIVIIDTLQVLMVLGVFGFIFIKSFPMSFHQLTNFKLLTKAQNHYFSKKLFLYNFLPTMLMPMFFSLIEQDLAQRFFAAKTKATATISAFFAAIILTSFSGIPLFLGMLAKIKRVTIPFGGNPLLPILTTLTSNTIFILAICAIMAAITSTANSLLSAISSNIVQDFGPYLPMNNRKLFISRLVSFIVGCSAVVAAYVITNDIISVLENSYRLSVICLLIPTVIAYFSKKLYAQAAWISLFCGIGGFVYATMYIQPAVFKDLIPLGCALAGYSIVHLITLLYHKVFSNS